MKVHLASLDDLDRAIIGQLQTQGRASLLSLAARLGVSHPTIRSRLNRLLRDKVISIVGIVDPWKVGFPMNALIGIRADLKQLAATIEALVRFEELTTVSATTGRYDLVVWGHFRDNAHLLEFLSHRLSKVKGIRSTETYQVLSMNKRIWQWNVPNGVDRVNFHVNALTKHGEQRKGGRVLRKSRDSDLTRRRNR